MRKESGKGDFFWASSFSSCGCSRKKVQLEMDGVVASGVARQWCRIREAHHSTMIDDKWNESRNHVHTQ